MDSIIYSISRCSICLFIWQQKVNIITSIFLGLAIYSYFYDKLDKREKVLDRIIIKADYYIQRINIMSEKSDVKLILDAVASFNDSINGFKDNIINTVRTDIKDLETRLLKHFDREITRTNDDVKEIKEDVETLKENAGSEKTELIVQKNKLRWTIGIGMVISSIIIGVINFFVIKGMS